MIYYLPRGFGAANWFNTVLLRRELCMIYYIPSYGAAYWFVEQCFIKGVVHDILSPEGFLRNILV